MTAKHIIKTAALFAGIFFSRDLQAANRLVWSDFNTEEILVGSTTGGPASRLFHAPDFVPPSDASPTGVASDGHYVYWATLRTGQIFRGTFDGVASELFGNSNTPAPVLPGEPRFVEGIATDGDSLYWYEQVRDHIQKGPRDGSSPAINLYPDALQGPYFGHGVATDSGYVYWPDAASDRILRANRDGSGPVTELFGPSDYPSSHGQVGIAVLDDFVYWTDVANGKIMRGAKDGSGNAVELYGSGDYPNTANGASPVGIAVDANFVYWSDTTTGQILRGAIAGDGPVDVLYDRSKYPGNPRSVYPQWIAIVPNVIPEPGSIYLVFLLLYGVATTRVPRKGLNRRA